MRTSGLPKPFGALSNSKSQSLVKLLEGFVSRKLQCIEAGVADGKMGKGAKVELDVDFGIKCTEPAWRQLGRTHPELQKARAF